MRKQILLLTGICCSVALLVSWTRWDDDKRNLKVLPKNISGDSLQMLMDEYTGSLNVNCAFCHSPKYAWQQNSTLDYTSDANHLKEVTRTMIQMTNEMNAEYMQTLPNKNVQMVTCYTCHRGEPMPKKKP
jgi:hypothetical protein